MVSMLICARPATAARLSARAVEHLQDSRDVRRARQAEQVAEAEQHQPRRENAQKEILDRRFLRVVVMLGQIKQDIGRDADQFQGQEQRDQIVGGADQADARR